MSTISTRVSRHIRAARANVYSALLDVGAVATWMVPEGMPSHVHMFEAREGGSFRISLSYDEQTGTGKTTALPSGLSPADNETGWRMALDKLAALVEAD